MFIKMQKKIKNFKIKSVNIKNANYIYKQVVCLPSSHFLKMKEIKRFYKKPSNKKRIEDDLMEKKILNYLEQFTQVKEVDVETKKLRENENVN